MHERRFRTYDRKVDVLGARKLGKRGNVILGNRRVSHLRLARGAGVAGRDEHLPDAFGGGALPRERVFTSARSDHQHAHVSA